MGKFFKIAHDMEVGSMVEDINKSCPHHGAKGKVIKSYPHQITFIVSNKGDKYSPGDKLTKTIDQMVKTSSSELTPQEKQKLFNQAIVSRFSVDAAKDDFARPHLKRYEKVKDLPLIGDTINKGIEWFIKRSKKKYPKTNQAISDLVTESPHTKKLTNKSLRKIVEDIADHTTKYNFDVKKLQAINEADSTAAVNAGVSPKTVYKSWK